jgi:hypothetical protein
MRHDDGCPCYAPLIWIAICDFLSRYLRLVDTRFGLHTFMELRVALLSAHIYQHC